LACSRIEKFQPPHVLPRGSGQKIVSDQTDGLEAAAHIFERPPMSGLGQVPKVSLGANLVCTTAEDIDLSREDFSVGPTPDKALR
jgi:hypothetical protein